MSRRIPDLEAHSRGSVDVHYLFGDKRGTDGGLCGWRGEGILDVAVHQRSLADALAAEHDDFGLEAVGHGRGSSWVLMCRRRGLGGQDGLERRGRALEAAAAGYVAL